MLYFHYTEKLVNLQGLIVKNVVQDHFSTIIFAQMPRKPHKCPCCHTSTDKIHMQKKRFLRQKNLNCGKKTDTPVKIRLLLKRRRGVAK